MFITCFILQANVEAEEEFLGVNVKAVVNPSSHIIVNIGDDQGECTASFDQKLLSYR